MNNYTLYWFERIIKILQLQLFISLVSFPLLGAWGLPLSVTSVIGNLLFTPWVALFIVLSTLLFFSHLLSLPNGWIVIILEYVTRVWYYCLSWGQKSWVVGIPSSLFPLTFLFAILACVILCHKRWGQLLESAFLLGLLYLFFWCAWYVSTPVNGCTILSKGESILSLIVIEDRVMLYDKGYLKRFSKNSSWVEYTFIPWSIKNTGTITIDKLFVGEFDVSCIPVLISLIEYARVHKLYLPYFDFSLNSCEWRLFFKLFKVAQKEGTIIERPCSASQYNRSKIIPGKMMPIEKFL